MFVIVKEDIKIKPAKLMTFPCPLRTIGQLAAFCSVEIQTICQQYFTYLCRIGLNLISIECDNCVRPILV